jgi:hypothetical protein
MFQTLRLLSAWLFLIIFQAQAAGPKPSVDLATCTRSATLLACEDAKGNRYGVATSGNTLTVQGYEAAEKRRWAQTNTRFKGLTFFAGVATDGEVWIGSIQRVGWTTITRLSSSSGTRSKVVCSRLNGCR